ncbi:MAG: hypothetical protein QXK65_02935 [Candidatus Micrarchaeaceae archaeon]
MKFYIRSGMWLLVAMLLATSMLSLSTAQGIGTSQVVLSNTSLSAYAGTVQSVSYIVKLASGSTWGTTLSVTNKASLSSNGISVALSQSYGDPTYSGTATITISASTPPGNYSVVFNASGDDPSPTAAVLSLQVMQPTLPLSSTTVPVSTIPLTPTFKTIASSSTIVNASKGAELSVQSGTVKVYIKPGTYALINGTKESVYNFSLITFSVNNVGSPPNYTDLIPGEAYAFAVNGKITPLISFVNASGADMPITSYVIAGLNTTSWTWFGGTYSNNTYSGGSYKFADVWSHPNSTAMINTQFYKPVVWVFEALAPITTTVTTAPSTTAAQSTAAATSKPTTTVPPSPSSSSVGLYAAAIIIVIIIIAAALAMRARGRRTP